MSHSLPILKNARIASPCNVAWSSMQGDDRTRYCHECNKRVYNLIGMNDGDVAQLFEAQGHDLCVQLYQRLDGTLMTEDCPTGIRAARRQWRRAMRALGAVATLLLTAGWARGHFAPHGGGLRTVRPFADVASWFAPAPALRSTPPVTRVRGRVRLVPPASATPPTPSASSSSSSQGGAS